MFIKFKMKNVLRGKEFMENWNLGYHKKIKWNDFWLKNKMFYSLGWEVSFLPKMCLGNISLLKFTFKLCKMAFFY